MKVYMTPVKWPVQNDQQSAYSHISSIACDFHLMSLLWLEENKYLMLNDVAASQYFLLHSQLNVPV